MPSAARWGRSFCVPAQHGRGNAFAGIALLGGSTDNRFEDNPASRNGAEGFLLVGVSGNALINSTANRNGSAGIDLRDSSNQNVLTGNVANLNEDGIRVFAESCGLAAMWNATGNVLQAVPANGLMASRGSHDVIARSEPLRVGGGSRQGRDPTPASWTRWEGGQAMSALLFRTRVAVLWVAVAVAMSGLLLLFLYVPGALEEMLAGKMEGETLDNTWGILFAALVVIPLVVAGLTLLVSDRVNHYLNLVAGLAFGLLGALPVMEIVEGTFDGHVVMALTACALGFLIAGLSGVELRQRTAAAEEGTDQSRPREGSTV